MLCGDLKQVEVGFVGSLARGLVRFFVAVDKSLHDISGKGLTVCLKQLVVFPLHC